MNGSTEGGGGGGNLVVTSVARGPVAPLIHRLITGMTCYVSFSGLSFIHWSLGACISLHCKGWYLFNV